jgi:hypothetical protein
MIGKIKRFFYCEPDVTLINPNGTVYLRRWWIIPRNSLCNIYLHQFLHDDEDRALHDHPWASLSIILKGGYIEHMYDSAGEKIQKIRNVGRFIYRKATHGHRIELHRDTPPFRLAVYSSSLEDNGVNIDAGFGFGARKYTSLEDALSEQIDELKKQSPVIPAWTLFITGPWQRTWGFICPQGWKSWREFLGVPYGQAKGDERGPGCGETL